jgi:hypothetical protein
MRTTRAAVRDLKTRGVDFIKVNTNVAANGIAQLQDDSGDRQPPMRGRTDGRAPGAPVREAND